MGVIPSTAVAPIRSACDASLYDLTEIAREAGPASNIAIPLVKALTAKVNEKARGYVHWGATSQDVIDTAFVLCARSAFVLMRKEANRRDAGAGYASRRASENDHARPHADAAGGADHVCLQGRRLAFRTDGRGGAPATCRGKCAGTAVRRRGRNARGARRGRREGPRCACREALIAGARDHLARRAWKDLRHRCGARRPFRRVRQDCRRCPAHDADGDRRSVRAGGRSRQGRLVSDAAQAQSRRRDRDPRQPSAHRRE